MTNVFTAKPAPKGPASIREAVGFSKPEDALQAAINDLVTHGFDRAALIDPADVFSSPSELVKSRLSARSKIDLLHRWAYNEKELEIASDDGMTSAKTGDKLQEIEIAIATLEAA
jgi:hypothetical protein